MDKFVLNFVKVLQRHTLYIIVSGYVAILFGRGMATDDIDIFIPKTSKVKLALRLSELAVDYRPKSIIWR